MERGGITRRKCKCESCFKMFIIDIAAPLTEDDIDPVDFELCAECQNVDIEQSAMADGD